jgi:uncharacterized repeat protein (TIGR01451 family)
MFRHVPVLRLFCLLGMVVGTRAWAQQPLALSASARSQIDGLKAEKAERSPGQRKMDSRLVHLVKKERGERLGVGLGAFEANIKPAAVGGELVDIKGAVTDALLAELRAVGAEIVASVPRFGAVRARVPWGKLEGLAARAEVKFIKPAARARTQVGSQTSAGDSTHAANTARATYQATGRGVKVGVLSNSVDFLPNVQATGDLGTVTVLPGQDGIGFTGGSLPSEGTAMLEIVHDLSPDAELFFASAFISEAQFAQNILDLRKAGCDIIVDDVFYLDESPFMDGAVAQAVDAVVADGALYFSSAGNEGNRNDNTSGTWEGDFLDGGPTSAPLAASGRVQKFGANNFNTIVGGSDAVTLFWADPYGASSNDYDLYVLDSTGTTVLASSTNFQTGSEDPIEFVESPGSGNRVVVVKADNAEPRFLHLQNFGGRFSLSTSGACAGHAAAASALAVAAVNAATASPNPFAGGAANPIELFSSDGPRRVFYYPDGTPITPGNFGVTGGLVRQKPDIAAADGVATATPNFGSFFGTSAAAPHAGAVAALVWSYNRALTPAQVRSALLSTALDIEGNGVDRDSGAGIVMAPASIQAVDAGPIISFAGATVTTESFAPPDSTVDPGETVTVSFTLQNVGGAAGDITATLLPVNGVTEPSGAQNYGTLAAGGGQATRSFTFVANGAGGGTLNATFAIQSGTTPLGNIVAPIVLGPAQPGADLNVQVEPAGPLSVGDTVTFAVQVFNNGGDQADGVALDATLPGAFIPFGGSISQGTGFFNGQLISIDYGSIPAGSSATLTLDCQVKSAGSAIVSFVSGLQGLDNDPSNNIGSTTVLVGRANLTPAPVIVSTVAGTDTDAATINATQPIFVDVAMNNGGNGPASQAFTTELYLDGVLQRTFAQLLPIAPGATARNVDVTLGPLSAGQHTLRVRVDAGTSVPETNEADNELVRTFTVLPGPAPNLTPGSIVVSNTTGTTTDTPLFQVTDSVFVDFSLTNNGQLVTGVASTADVFLDNALVSQKTISATLGVGQSAGAVDFPLGSLAAGSHTIRVVLDSGNVLAESNEADNEFTKTFAVNAAPTIAGLSNVTINEDDSTGPIPFTVGDVETPAANLVVNAMSSVPTFTVLVAGTGAARNVTVTPPANANGSATITVTVQDGTGGQTSGSFMLTVNPVNDPPSFTASGDVTVAEDSGPATINAWATNISPGPADETGQNVSFAVTNDQPALFSAQPAISSNGVLTFTPAPNANGQATVTVVAHDTGGLEGSTPITFTITVTPGNDAPTFTLGGNLVVAQDAGPQAFTHFASSISPGPADEATQTVSFAVQANNTALFAVQPAIASNGTLTFTPAPTASGKTSVSVTATDSGGAASTVQTFQIAVTSFAEETGSYTGLVGPVNPAGSSVDQVGRIDLRIRPQGDLSGRLVLGTARYSFKGFVLNDGRVRFGNAQNTATLQLRRRGKPTLALALNLDVTGTSGTLTGTIVQGVASFADVTAERAGYDARTHPALPPLVGTYTALLEHRIGTNNGVPRGSYPQGDGGAMFRIRSNGILSLRGTLADGSKISAAAPISAPNLWPLFAATNARRGAVSGLVDLSFVGSLPGGLLWHKPANTRAARYSAGWPGGIIIDLIGSPFVVTSGQSVLPALGAVDTDGNAEFRATDGGLAATFVKALAIDARDRDRVVTPAADGFRLSINHKTGMATGRFKPVGEDRALTFRGTVLQSESRISGFFPGRKEVGGIAIAPDDTPGGP